MSFINTKSKMKDLEVAPIQDMPAPDPSGILSEADPNFDKKASVSQLKAQQIAERVANMSEDQARKNLGAAKDIRAKYKIEVTFERNRTINGPNLAGIQIWESGKRFHGGGDDLMYWCKDNRNGRDDGCWGPITSDCIKGGIAFCPKCEMTVNVELLTNMRIVKLPTTRLAEILADLFRKMQSNCDIYLKYHATDIRVQAMEREKGREIARRLKGMHIYALRAILKDTAHGADLVGRFRAFLSS